MNPKKKSRRYRVSVSIHALDLAIYRFTHSLECIIVENEWQIAECTPRFEIWP
jgi:hypothetical protein